MALPLIPLLFGAAALLVLSKKKSAPPPAEGEEPDYQPGSGGGGGVPPGPSGGLGGRVVNTLGSRYTPAKSSIDVWGKCAPPAGSPVGTYAALGLKGECVVFWNPGTWSVMSDILGAEFKKLSKSNQKSICKADECIPNPFAEGDSDLFCQWRANPKREAFIINGIAKAFPQLAHETFPPNGDTKHFPKMVWTFTSNLFSSEFCGIGRVT